MEKRMLRLASVAAVLSAAAVVPAAAQGYPERPVRVVTSGAGGGLDVAARLIGPHLGAGLGQQVVIDNRASGVIPGEIVSKAAPDGHTLLFFGSTFWIGPLIQKAPYDPVRDFSPISLTNRAPSLLSVHPSVPAKTVAELVALAKARPGALNYGTSGTGAPNHLAGELFRSMAGVEIVRVPYKASGAAVTALMSGEIQLMFVPAASAAPHLKSGRLRALAVTSAEPSPLAPNLPTIAASGLPGYESVSIYAMFAPAKTPATVIGRLNREIATALQRPELRDRLFATGLESVGGTPQQLAAVLKAEMERVGKLIREAGIREN
jgi:tripartite-type tricarboxylate transporter receptor subunit TctC